MGILGKKKNVTKDIKLVMQEMTEDPFHKFNIAFALMSVIPFLVSLYILVTRLFSFDVLVGDVGVILIISIFVSLCGLFIGYSIISNILKKVIENAAIAKQCSITKSSFVATVSHELRNPIFILSANMEGLLEGIYGQLDGKQTETVKMCKGVVDRMGSLVANLLDLYKIEAGLVKLKKEQYDIRELTENQINEMEILAKKKNLKLEKNFPARTFPVWADKDKIIQVVNNILSNAIKYTPDGGIVTTSIFQTGEFVRIEIEDTGPGIPENMLQKIFDKFERIDESKQGMGLGLAISKDIIDLHGGKIWAESHPVKGMKFVVVLPVV
jgi:signal transduction histidine kinase